MLCVPGLLQPEPLSLWQATADPCLHSGHSKAGLAQSWWGLWVLVSTGFVWALQGPLVGMEFDSKYDFTPPTILLGLLLCPFTLFFFFFFLVGCNILWSIVVHQWVAILEFSQKLSAHPTLPSCAGLKFNIQKTKILASGPITSWQVYGETMETLTDYFLGLQNHWRWWLQPWN